MKCHLEVMDCLKKIEGCIYNEKHDRESDVSRNSSINEIEMLIVKCMVLIKKELLKETSEN
jgi:hypothetical protein